MNSRRLGPILYLLTVLSLVASLILISLTNMNHCRSIRALSERVQILERTLLQAGNVAPIPKPGKQ